MRRRTGLAAWLHSLVGGGSRSGGSDAGDADAGDAAAAAAAQVGYSGMAKPGVAGGGAGGDAANTSGPQARCVQRIAMQLAAIMVCSARAGAHGMCICTSRKSCVLGCNVAPPAASQSSGVV